MTDREPDDLYDALRRRLADHGQEPPAPLWANIRAQLPPPVAAPQLRKRSHKRTAAALLLLLLAVVGTVGWQWWRVGQRRELAQQAARRADQQNQLATVQPGTAQAPDAARSGSASEGPVAGVAPASDAASSSAPTSATPAVAAAGEAAPGTATPRNAVAGDGTGPVSGPGSTGAVVASGAITAASRPAVKTATGRTEGIAMVGRSARKRRFAAALVKPATEDQEAASAARPGPAGRPVNVAAVTVAVVAPRAAASEEAGRMNDIGATPGSQSGLANGEMGSTQAAADAGISSREAASSTWTSPLALRRATLSPVEMAALRLALPADTLPRLPAVPVRRWAVQVVGGPAYTYRHLSQSNDLAYNAPSSPTPNTIRSFDTAGSVREQQEQAGTGLALALQVRRVLSGRWSLSAGLGYQEYALQRTYDEVKAITSSIPPVVVSNPRPPVTTYVFTQSTYRDTYRFLTVPVRLSYVLGATKKLSYAFSGGADAAFYLGGNSAGSDAARHAWGPGADGPNRALNLSLSGGLDVRYRVAPRLELLAQPSATYFLNSLAKPVSGLTPRHLLGAGVLLGVSYDWR
ncbi:hypothetical protein [Hymenobacter armeniacus]|uniref:Outer membrane protein beta-barrel domain-containing protein n=1 Tax=Hymenobacter armeniacus TaxID=2771358 RepID=A0ABR8JP29_9BACT|nr:hypothetical protein [Hymenobacter armeniacus]MBD2720541.1 hypothetical protein [Hymenobacter armeniacus]